MLAPARCRKQVARPARGSRAALTKQLSGRPASRGCCRRVGYFPSSTACRAHAQPSRHTMAHNDAAAAPYQPAAPHRSQSHSINQLSRRVVPQRRKPATPQTRHCTFTHSRKPCAHSILYAAATAHCKKITQPPQVHHTPHNTELGTSHTTHNEQRTPRLPRTACAPDSRKRRQAAQCGRKAARQLVAVQEQLPAGHMNSHHVIPWHPTLLSYDTISVGCEPLTTAVTQ